jgi:hypothetical protein
VPHSRDFVHWRFLDAGELSLRTVSLLPASKNQNRNGHSHDPFAMTASRANTLRTLTHSQQSKKASFVVKQWRDTWVMLSPLGAPSSATPSEGLGTEMRSALSIVARDGKIAALCAYHDSPPV